MFCKFCGRELEPECKACPDCGKAVSTAEGWKIAVIVISALILAAVLTVAVLFGTGVLGDKDSKSKPVETTAPTTEATEPEDAPDFRSYTVDDALAAEKADEIIATVGDMQLTNSELQLHYWSQVFNFLNEYGYYLSMFGMDLSKGLDEQPCAVDETMSWEEYFLNQALESWKSYAMLCQMAEAEGFELSEEGKEYIANLPTTLEEEATTYGYKSVEEMLLEQTGPGTTVDGMIAYRTTMYISMQYFAEKFDSMAPTEDEVVAYFEENAADFEASGITKDSGKLGDVRHILIKVEGGTTDENGQTVYSDEEWAACLAEAERVYGLWKDGEATEESFIAMVPEHSDDGGSVTTGGLYEGIAADSNYVEPFKEWAIDPARQVGDTALVKVEASNYGGYHFMYYVGGQDVWYATASSQLQNERCNAFLSAGIEQYPMETDLEKIGLGYISLAG